MLQLHDTTQYDQSKELLAHAAKLLEAASGQKNDPPGSPAGPYLHGPAGLFNERGLANPVFSAIPLPKAGVADSLPVLNGSRMLGGEFGGLDANFVTMLTGVTKGAADTFSNQPTTACADGPIGGLLKMCSIVNPYGNFVVSTNEVDMDRAGRLADRCDDFAAQLANTPVFSPLMAKPTSAPSLNNAINNELAARIFEMLVSFGRMFGRRTWIGSPANNSGERKDILGLEIQVNTGTHVDAMSSAICTAADPDVKNFNFSLVTGAAKDIIQYLEMVDNYIHWNASQQGLTIDDGFMALRPELWLVLSSVIPVRQYQAALQQINLFTNGRVMVNANDAQRDRNDYRRELNIPLNGRIVRVVPDDTMSELNVTTASQLSAGQYASDIFYIPTRVNGIPVTYWECWDHDNAQSRAIAQWVNGLLTFSTDGGRFRWHVNFKNGCLKINVKFKPRLMLHTPQLAWRISNVAYEPLQHLRSYDPDSVYFADGGRAEGTTQQYYRPWATTTLGSL